METIKCPVCGGKLELHQIYFDRTFDYDGVSLYDPWYHYECDSCPFASKAAEFDDEAWTNLQELRCIFPRSKKKVEIIVGGFNGVSLYLKPRVIKTPNGRRGFFNINGTISHWSFEMKG